MAEATIGAARCVSPGISQDLSIADSDSTGGVTVTDPRLALNARQAGGSFGLVGSLSRDAAASSGDLMALADPPSASQQAAPQTSSPPAQPVIGHAVEVEGHVTVIRNGVTIILSSGDAILKGDVVETGHDGSAGLVFADGDAFQVGHDSRVALDEREHDAVVLDQGVDTTASLGRKDGQFTLAQTGPPKFITEEQVKTDADKIGEVSAFDAILKLQLLAKKLFSDAVDTHTAHGSSTPPDPVNLSQPGSGDIPGPPPIPQLTFPQLTFPNDGTVQFSHNDTPGFFVDALLGLSGATVHGIEGKTTGTLQLATFSDANAAASEFTPTINWGDGSSTQGGTVVSLGNGNFAVEGAHTYAGEGSYAVGITITEADGITVSATSTAEVSDAPLAATGVAISATEGLSIATARVATFTDANINASASDFTATINWGDGSTTQNAAVVALGGGHFAVEGAHTYAEEGSYTVGVAVQDDGGSTANTNSTANVADAPLMAGTMTANGGVEGVTPTTLSATFSDANTGATASDFSGTIDWGDGTKTTFTSADVSGSNGAFTVCGSHQYAEEGNAPIRVTINDDGGSAATESGAATVKDAPLTAGIVTASGGVEGVTPTTLSATFGDANTDATASDFSGTIDWGDGSKTTFTSADVSGSYGAFTVGGSHQYAGDGNAPISVTVNDDGGSTTTESGNTNVADAPLTAGTVTASGGVEGVTPTTLSATFGDANTGATTSDFSGTIDWGDGTKTAFTSADVSGSNGAFAVSGSHQYAEDGSAPIGVTINDDGGSATTESGAATVKDAPLTAGSVAANGGVEGVTPTTLSATFSDANTGATTSDFSGTINWGDGTKTTFTSADVSGSNGAFTVSGSHQYAEDGNAPISVTINDDGGSATTESGNTKVADAPLTAGTVTANGGVEGVTPTTLSATFGDANTGATTSDFSGTIDWGDGTKTAFTSADVSGSNGAFTVSGSHQYAEEGLFAPVVTILDTGGSTASEIGSSVVTDAPLTNVSGVTINGVEASSTGLVQVATFTDTNTNAPASDFTATITWGDGNTTTNAALVSLGNGNFEVEGAHTYAEEGGYTIAVAIQDTGGSNAQASSTATVADAPLTNASGVNLNAIEGTSTGLVQVATFTDANTSAPASDFTATITWGDGNTTTNAAVVALGNGNFAVEGAHTYAEEGGYTVDVAIADDGGSTANASSTAAIADAPLTRAAVANLNGVEGVSTGAVQLATFTDGNVSASAGDFTATIDWGDGTSTPDATVVVLGNGHFAVNGAHVYANQGSFTIGVTIADDGGSTASANGTATIVDPAPTNAAGTNLSGVEGTSTGNVEVATFSDADLNAPVGEFNATINWGDGSTTTNATVDALGGGNFAVEGAHTYAEHGSYAVGVMISEGGSTASAGGHATIADAPLTDAAGANITAAEGSSTGTVEVATFADQNALASASDFTATIAWGDGATSQHAEVVSLGGGQFAVEGAHTYTGEGSFSITVNVADDGGSTASAAGSAVISGPPPVVTTPTVVSNDPAGPATVMAGDVLSASASGNSDDTITYQWFSSADGYTHAIGTGQSYTVGAGDAGNSIEVLATSTNEIGATITVPSAPLTVTQPALVAYVANEADLVAAINDDSVGGRFTGSHINFEIVLTANIMLTTALPAINLASGNSLIINGGNFTLDGNNQFRGLFAFGGNIAIDNLNIKDTLARGGAGGAYGGGGAGLGGGLFVGSGASVTINNVNFVGDRAIGGAGGVGGGYREGGGGGGGGGGMSTAGAAGVQTTTITSGHYNAGKFYHYWFAGAWNGGAGGVGVNVPGHSYAQGASGAIGHSGQSGPALYSSAGTGSFGGGGGGGFYGYERFGQVYYSQVTRSYRYASSPAGNGGFGGGGGGGSITRHGGISQGGAGGFGGGGGAGGGMGGYGAGNGAGGVGDGGGGLGAGGAIFVEGGGHLIINGGSISGGSVAGGASGYNGGAGLGSGIFLQGNETITFAPASGETLTISNVIADQHNNGGVGNVEISGNGIVHFAAANSYDGTTTIDAGATLDIDVGGTPGAGAVIDNGILNVNGATTFAGAVTNNGELDVGAAATFNGAVTDNATLDVNVGSTFASAVTIASTGELTVNASSGFTGGVADLGTLNIEAGSSFSHGFSDNGIVNVDAPTTFQNAFFDNGQLNLAADGTVDFTGSFTGNGTINFAVGHVTTAEFASGVPSQTITGFANGDIIDLESLVATSASLGAANVLTLENASGKTVATLHFDPTETLGPIAIRSDGQGGTDVVAVQTTFNVNSAAELNAALTAISVGGSSEGSNVAYTIHFTGNISLSSLAASGQLAAINLDSGSSLLIDGAGFALDGANAHRGILDDAGNVTIRNLTIANMQAQGGAGGAGGGGGGAGLGGGLFVAAGASATISDVAFKYDAAHGGAGAGISTFTAVQAGGGGGGMGTAGAGAGTIQVNHNNGGGLAGGTGGDLGLPNLPDEGGAGATSYRGSVPAAGGFGGGGGGAGAYSVNGVFASRGGPGGFGGGGGGGGGDFTDGRGSYGLDNFAGGAGGFGGGGGGGGNRDAAAQGGFGAGKGGASYLYSALTGPVEVGAVGGGGLGAGGGVFVQEGGSLVIESGSISGGSVAGGAAGPVMDDTQVNARATAGEGLGSGIFLQGNEILTFAPASGETATISDVIADQGGNGGSGAVDIKGAGVVEFDGANTYSGGTTIETGAMLELAGQGNLGSGPVTDNGELNVAHSVTLAPAINDNGSIYLGFQSSTAVFSGAVALNGSLDLGTGFDEADFNGGLVGSGQINFGAGGQTLKITGAMPSAIVHNFTAGDTIDLAAIQATGIGSLVNNVLTLTGAGGATVATINFDPAQQNLAPHGFLLTSDGGTGTDIMLNQVPVFQVASAAALVQALKEINVGGVFSGANQNYEIDIVGNFSLDQALPNINLAQGDSLTIHGGGHTIDGASIYSGFDLQSGNATIDHLTISDFVQRGGDGASPGSNSAQGGGGGGLGAGGGLFIGQGSAVTLTDVAFTGDQAIGGNGGHGGTYLQTFSPPFKWSNGDAAGGAAHPGQSGVGYGGSGGTFEATFDGGSGGSFGGGGGGGASGIINGNGSFSQGGAGGGGGYGAGSGGGGSSQGFTQGGGGGGGAGLGGAVFVATGGELNISDWNFSNNDAVGGAGGGGGTNGTAGQGIGNDLFSYGGTVELTTTAGQTLTINQLIVGSQGTFNISGPGDVSVLDNVNVGNLDISGSGNVLLHGVFTGHTAITDTGTGTLTIEPVYNVATEADLVAAIQAIDGNPITGVSGVNYIINIENDLSLNALLPAISVTAGDKLTVEGNGHTIDGGNTFGGFYLRSGAASFSDLNMQHLTQRGQNGGDASLIFFIFGGSSGQGSGGGGGGGLGAGGAFFVGSSASATITNVNITGSGAIGGNGGNGGTNDGHAGFNVPALAGGGGFIDSGVGYQSGGVGGSSPTGDHGAAGAFGGGGGGGYGNFQLQYALGHQLAGSAGGYGAGNGGASGIRGLQYGGGGGGAAGLGGGIFVASGGSLTVSGGDYVSGNYVQGGVGGSGYQNGGNGVGLGAGLFTASNNVTLAPDAGQTLTIKDSIQGGTLHIGGAGAVVLGDVTATTINDAGALSLTGVLTNDTITVAGSSVLTLTAGAAGAGVITFLSGAQATLIIDAGAASSNEIDGFLPGDTIKLAGFGTNAHATLGAGNILTVSDGTNSAQLQLTPSFNYSGVQFNVTAYDGGVAITETIAPQLALVGHPVNSSGNGVTVQFNGSAAPNVTVQILMDGNQVGTVTPDANGNFTFTTSAIADGQYTFTATQTADGQILTTVPLVVDVLPEAPTLALGPDMVVNGGTATVTGTAETNTTINFYLDGSTTAFKTTSTGNGTTFSVDTQALSDGVHTISATVTDAQGIVGAASSIVVDVNPTAPSITTLVGQPIAGGTIRVQGTGEPNHTILIFADNGTVAIGSGVTNSSGQFDITTSATFADGTHTLTAETHDAAANLFSTASSIFNVDVGPVAPSTVAAVGQTVSGSTAEVKGTALANSTITIYEGNTAVGTGSTDGNGQFDFHTSQTFTDGIHHLAATVTDANSITGSAAPFTLVVVPDTPTLSAVLSTPQKIEFQGTGEANETIQVFNGGSLLGQGTADQNGNFDFSLAISGGSHAISVSETDSAGLTSASSSSVAVDVAPKAPTFLGLEGQPTNSSLVTVAGLGEVGDKITLYADGGSMAIGSGFAGSNAIFEIQTTVPLSDGIHTLTAIDSAGSVASAPSTAFTVDVLPDAVQNLSQVGVTLEGGTLHITGTGESGETVTLSIGNTVIGTAQVVDGSFDAITAPDNVPGVQQVTVTETDSAGLTSNPTTTAISVVPPAPTVNSVGSVPDSEGRIEVKGTADPGTTIALYADGSTTAIGTGTVDASGHFDVYSSFGSISAGQHNITTTETATGGVTGASSALVPVTVTTTPETWTIASAEDLAKAIAAIDVSGASAQAGTHYTFNIVGNLQLTDQLPAFNLPQGASLTIEGNDHTLDANGQPGLFVYAGNVAIDDLSVINAVTQGGQGAFGGGGGAGLGGGLFIASAGAVTLSDVSFANDKAAGGNGSVSSGSVFGTTYVGGGGGLGGSGGKAGGGGIGVHASGANFPHYSTPFNPVPYTAAGAGIVIGAASGSSTVAANPAYAGNTSYAGGANGGGGAQGVGFAAGMAEFGGGYTLDIGTSGNGGGIGASGTAGGFGGGGGGGGITGWNPTTGATGYINAGAGGFGGGGGGHDGSGFGGNGGFGGGGGGGYGVLYTKGIGSNALEITSHGGFGGGNGYVASSGGGGLGAGGAIFVQQGGTLTFAGSGSEQNDSVAYGLGGFGYTGMGSAYGSGMFLQGDETITFAPDAGHTITLTGDIADVTGSNDHSGQIGGGALVVDGQGTLVLSGDNTFTGGILLESGTLDVISLHGAGSGAITITNAAAATLEINAASGALPNAIIIDNFQATAESYSNGVLTLTDASGDTLNITLINPGAHFGSDLSFTIDSVDHTTTITGPQTSWTNVHGGDWGATAGGASTSWSSIIPTAADDATIAPAASTAPYTVSITQGELAQAHNLTINDANATLDDQGILMLSAALSLNAGTFSLDGGNLQAALSVTIAGGATFEGDGTVSVLGSGGVSMSGMATASDTAAGGPALDFASAVSGNGSYQIDAGATLEFGSAVASGATITFERGTGELKLDNPEHFNGVIAGFNGIAPNAQQSDVVDLAGIDGNHLTTESYNTTTGVLTVSDGTNTANLTFSNFNDTFTFASDGNGGTLVFDPPATAPAPLSAPATPSNAAGNSVTSDGAAPNAWSASELGHNFVFQPGMGAVTIQNFDHSHDAIELDHFASTQAMQQLTSLISSDTHGDAVIDLSHNDSITFANVTPQLLQAVLNNVVHLH